MNGDEDGPRSPADDSGLDRRAGERATSVFRPVLIELDGFTGFSLIRNLSPHGMMGQVYAHFAPDQDVIVHFNPDTVATGKIVWSKDQRIGVQFKEEIDVDGVLSEFGRHYNGSRINRAPRLQIDCSGELVVKNQTLATHVQDISQRGVKVTTSLLRPGDEVVVRLPDMKDKKAVVRWVQQESSGLNFLAPLGFEELARWIIGIQSQSVPGTGMV